MRPIAISLVLLFTPAVASANPIDDTARDMLRLPDSDARRIARTGSDVLVTTLIAAPLLLDAGKRNWSALGADSIAFLTTSGLALASKHLSNRNRPYQSECISNGAYAPGCGTMDSHLSFFSGHTASAFTGATIICGREPSWCATSMTLAGVTGLLRIASDQHHLTDVIVGAGTGIAVGWLLPRWLEPWFQPPTPTEEAKVAARLSLHHF